MKCVSAVTFRPHLTPHKAPRSVAPAKALPAALWQLAAEVVEKPGTVEAPVSAVFIGAVVVTALSFGVAQALKPGIAKQEEMRERECVIESASHLRLTLFS